MEDTERLARQALITIGACNRLEINFLNNLMAAGWPRTLRSSDVERAANDMLSARSSFAGHKQRSWSVLRGFHRTFWRRSGAIITIAGLLSDVRCAASRAGLVVSQHSGWTEALCRDLKVTLDNSEAISQIRDCESADGPQQNMEDVDTAETFSGFVDRLLAGERCDSIPGLTLQERAARRWSSLFNDYNNSGWGVFPEDAPAPHFDDLVLAAAGNLPGRILTPDHRAMTGATWCELMLAGIAAMGDPQREHVPVWAFAHAFLNIGFDLPEFEKTYGLLRARRELVETPDDVAFLGSVRESLGAMSGYSRGPGVLVVSTTLASAFPFETATLIVRVDFRLLSRYGREISWLCEIGVLEAGAYDVDGQRALVQEIVGDLPLMRFTTREPETSEEAAMWMREDVVIRPMYYPYAFERKIAELKTKNTRP